mgnify:CR=1 FL=1
MYLCQVFLFLCFFPMFFFFCKISNIVYYRYLFIICNSFNLVLCTLNVLFNRIYLSSSFLLRFLFEVINLGLNHTLYGVCGGGGRRRSVLAGSLRHAGGAAARARAHTHRATVVTWTSAERGEATRCRCPA